MKEVSTQLNIDAHTLWMHVELGNLRMCLPLYEQLAVETERLKQIVDVNEELVCTLTGTGYLSEVEINELRTHRKQPLSCSSIAYLGTLYTFVRKQAACYVVSPIFVTRDELRVDRSDLKQFLAKMKIRQELIN